MRIIVERIFKFKPDITNFKAVFIYLFIYLIIELILFFIRYFNL
jgi:hypothetical protein